MPDTTYKDAILAIVERSGRALAKMGQAEAAKQALAIGIMAGETEAAAAHDPTGHTVWKPGLPSKNVLAAP